jgi:hypothetical protein
MVCHKFNAKELWSDLPTYGHVTDLCESMLRTEWKFSSDWIPYRISKCRWLVMHHLDNDHYCFNYWSDKDNDSDTEKDNGDHILGDVLTKKFGHIP